MQGKEPSAGLVNTFGNKIGREIVLEESLFSKG